MSAPIWEVVLPAYTSGSGQHVPELVLYHRMLRSEAQRRADTHNAGCRLAQCHAFIREAKS
jgi:hypothetical protein